MNKYIGYLLTLCVLAFGLTGCDDDDATAIAGMPTVAFATSVLKTMENVTPLQIPFTLNHPAPYDIKVTVAVKSEEGAKENIHYKFQSKEVNIAKGSAIGYFFVDLTDDRDINPDRIFTIELMQATGAILAEEGYTCRIVIQSDEGFPGIGFKNTLMSAPEEQEVFELPVVLSKPYTEPVSFKVNVKDGGTALPDVHFTIDEEKVYTIPAGDTLTNVEVRIIDNDTVNENAIFELRIVEAEQASITEIYQECKVTIVNDERNAYVSFLRSTTQAFESDGQIWIPIQITGVYKLPVTVTIALEDGSAVRGTDYEPEQFEITFENGKMLDSIPIRLIDNDITNVDKYFTASIAQVQGALIAEKGTEIKATILNDDINLKTLYDDLMGSWTITQTHGDGSRPAYSATLTISGGNTPDEEDANYGKILVCHISNYVWADVDFKIRLNAETGQMELICGETIMTYSKFGGDLEGKTCHMKFFHINDEQNADPINITHNKNFTELSWEKGVTAIVFTEEESGDVRSTFSHFSMENVVMIKNK